MDTPRRIFQLMVISPVRVCVERTETPSARVYPFPPALKDLQAASGESIFSRLKATDIAGRRIAEAPPTMAKSIRPNAMSVIASCNATRDDEHAAPRNSPNFFLASSSGST
jgi:hypothetical protein